MRTESFRPFSIIRRLALASVVLITIPLPWICAQVVSSIDVLDDVVETSPVEVTFLIETITIEGNRHFTSEVILSESLLREGGEYSERQLREAVKRIVRRPLVLDADFFLRRGSERGKHTLVIEVEEASRWFLGFDIEGDFGDTRVPSFDGFLGENSGGYSTDLTGEESLFVGWRSALGRNGVASVAANVVDGQVQLGYTHYNLIAQGTRISASYISEPRNGNFVGEESLRLDLGVPIRGNHSLNVVATRARLDSNSFSFSRESTSVGVAWLLNTLNDPVFPTEGKFVTVGIQHLHSDERFSFSSEAEGIARQVETSNTSSLATISAERYWSISEKSSLSTRGSVSRVKIKGGGLEDLQEVSVEGRFARFLWRKTEKPHWRELWWETSFEVFRNEFSGIPEFGGAVELDGFRVGSGLKFRSKWGVVQLAAKYVETGND